MATNIEYNYHPPIDIGTHVPLPPVDLTTSFREHLASRKDAPPQTDAPVDEPVSNDSSYREPAKRDEPLQHIHGERAVEEDAAEEVEAHPEQSTQADESLESEGIVGRDDVEQSGKAGQDHAPSSEQGEEVTPPSTSTLKSDATLESAAQKELDGSGNSKSGTEISELAKNGPQFTDDVVPKITTPTGESSESEDAEAGERNSVDKTLTAERAEGEQTQPGHTLARRDQPLVANETAKSDSLASQNQPQDIVTPEATQAKQEHGARDKKAAARNESSGTELEQANARPIGAIADRERQMPPILTELVARADDEASVESVDSATKPSSQPTSNAQEIESTQTHGAAGHTRKEGNASDRLSSVLSASRPSESSQSPLTDSQQSRLVQRVAKAFDIARARGDSSVRLRLTPPQLGALRIELQVESGSLTARLEVETQAAREALLENLNTLRNRLAEQNIRVDQFDVDVLDQRSDNPWGNGERQESSHREGSNESPASPKTNDESTSAITRVTTELLLEEGVIDVII